MKNKWGNYSLKDGKVQGSYIREYSCLSPKKQIQKDHYGKANSRTEERDQPEDSPRRIMAECYLPGTQSDSSGQAGSLASPIPSAENTTSNLRGKMKASEKKMLVKHINKDDKEFRAQIKDDVKLKKEVLKSKPGKESPKEKRHEARESKRYEKMEDKK
jgi:hypothetical protein